MILDFFVHVYTQFKKLRVGFTLRNLKYCQHPWLTLWQLIWPFPWKYRLPALLDPLEIRDHPNVVHQRYYVDENYRRLRSFTLFQLRDTPLRSLYRFHDVLCMDNQNYIMLDGDYFWRRAGWRIKDIPDPKDPNPLRYAILAGVVEAMVRAFNRKISIGLRRGVGVTSRAQDEAFRSDPNKPFEEAPDWASRVPAVNDFVSFLEKGSVVNYTTELYKRRICANASQLENI